MLSSERQQRQTQANEIKLDLDVTSNSSPHTYMCKQALVNIPNNVQWCLTLGDLTYSPDTALQEWTCTLLLYVYSRSLHSFPILSDSFGKMCLMRFHFDSAVSAFHCLTNMPDWFLFSRSKIKKKTVKLTFLIRTKRTHPYCKALCLKLYWKYLFLGKYLSIHIYDSRCTKTIE